MSVVMAALLRPNKPPHWAMLAVLVCLAFVIAIVWLNIIANEVVSVLTALGLLLNIKTGETIRDPLQIHCTDQRKCLKIIYNWKYDLLLHTIPNPYIV